MRLNLKYLISVAVVLFLLYLVYNFFMASSPAPVAVAPMPQVADLGMYDFDDPNAFGTTLEADRRWENASVRKEFNKNPFPLAEDSCGQNSCPVKGCPNPAKGDLHVCKAGWASKRMIDAMGGNHMIPHMCAPCSGQLDEPSQLGRWWSRKQCASPESVGLDLRPLCSRCGN